uniref:Uncharacterized protein n=1 Tax=Odontella aurita TaxID=265563 RepID=A0A7S4HU34_9STRA|mmetsp:Transcript_15082/g.43802  ORF Transcript_15082/g.43802 Transcript_15082/m.43802 type:complete len:182 (+) Transcript_15082:76-621(+)
MVEPRVKIEEGAAARSPAGRRSGRGRCRGSAPPRDTKPAAVPSSVKAETIESITFSFLSPNGSNMISKKFNMFSAHVGKECKNGEDIRQTFETCARVSVTMPAELTGLQATDVTPVHQMTTKTKIFERQIGTWMKRYDQINKIIDNACSMFLEKCSECMTANMEALEKWDTIRSDLRPARI